MRDRAALGRPHTSTDQAWIERLFSHIKADWPHLDAIDDPAVLRAELALVRVEYNTVRLHAGIGYVTPDDEHDDGAVRERIITTVFDNVPLASGGDRPKLERAVGDALDQAGELGIFTTILLLVAASGVMGALRHSINEAWDIEQRPPLLQRKALDFALVLGGTSILALSVSLTVTHRLADIVDDEAGGFAVTWTAN